MSKLLVVVLVALALTASGARAGSIGVGVYGGPSVPVLQDDQDNGTLYGIRAPVKLIPLFTAEPFYSKSSLGDKTFDLAPGVSVTREGSDVTTYGVNAMLTLGGPIAFYPYVGIGEAKFKRTGQNESRKLFNITVGASYAILSLP